MRVAFDAAFLRLPPSGIGGYVQGLVPALQASDSTLDLRLLEPDWDHTAPRQVVGRNPLQDKRLQRLSWELAGVATAARRVNPDLVHIPSFAAPLRPPCPFVVTIHDVIPFVLPAYRASRAMQVNLAVMRRTVRRARLVIAPSQAAADDIARELGIPGDRIRVTLEATDARHRPSNDSRELAATRARFGIRGRYIFNVGGLDVRKNVPLLIHAFAQLRARIDEPVQLVIAGAPHSANPAVFPPLEPVIRRLGLENDVLLAGRISDADKIALYQGAAVYATPSYYEGFGLTPLEAMACGAPTIAADRTSFPEVVGDGGLLVEVDAGAFAAAMERVLTDDALAAELRGRGLARAATFTWERTAWETLAVYREAIGG